MPFWLSNAPATFPCMMNMVMAPYLRRFCTGFHGRHTYVQCVHDRACWTLSCSPEVAPWSSTLREDKQMLVCLWQFGVLRTYHFSKGVATDPKKTQARPGNLTELHGFHSLTRYYRKFVHSYAINAKPLTNLLKKKSFQCFISQWSFSSAQAWNCF